MSQYTNKQIRDFLVEFFADDDEEFEFFCDDHYSEVKEMFGEEMSAKKRAHLLTQHCAATGSFEQLLTLLKETYPDKYAKVGLPIDPSEPQVAPVAEPPAGEETIVSASAIAEPAAQPAGQDVFISYSRRDETFIKQLYQALTGQDISAWYDRFNIGVGNQWTEEIVKGIRDCRVFLLVLSPDSTASANVRKEVDLAQRYDKRIVPLMWRKVEIPVAMEYQLAGIQWIEFNEDANIQKFDQLADVIRRLIGGASMAEATSGAEIAKESNIPAIQEAVPLPQESPGGRRLLGGLKKASTINPVAIGGLVISGVVTTFGIDVSDQDFVNGELKWLFYAADHLLKIQAGEAEIHQPVPVTIPLTAERSPQTNNQVLSASLASAFGPQVEKIFTRIKTHLDNLNLALAQEVQLGEAGRFDQALQYRLKNQRLDIVEKDLRELAVLMEQAYGVLVTVPDQLSQFLKG
jgi:hypothetical protein